jgi:outer membrane protein TolC
MINHSKLKNNILLIRNRLIAGISLLTILFSLPNPVVVTAQVSETENAPELTLRQAIETALANATDIKQAMFDVMDADELETAAWGEVFPTISANMGYQRNLELPVNFVPAKFFDQDAPDGELVALTFGAENSWAGGVSVNQVLFRGEAFVGISTSRLFRQAQQENYRATAQQVVTQARTAYYSVLVARQELALQQATINRLRQNLEENRKRLEAGLVDDYNVLQLQVQLKNEEPDMMRARNKVEEAYRGLNIAIGLPVYVKMRVVGELESFDIQSKEASDSINQSLKEVDRLTAFQLYEIEEETETNIKDSRGDLRALGLLSDLQDKRILADYSLLMPTLSASYNLSWNASQKGTPDFFGTDRERARSQVLGLSLNWTIFDGFSKTTAIQRSIIEKKKIEEQRRNAVQNAINQVATAQDNIKRLFDLAPSLQEGVDLAERGYQRALTRFNNGVGSQLEVKDAEVQLRQSKLNYATLVYNYLTAKAQYDQAIGMVPFIDMDFNTDTITKSN